MAVRVEVRQGMNGQVTVAALAEKLGINRSNLHKRIRREGVKTAKVPCTTGGGVQWLTTVPKKYADQMIRHYEKARATLRKCRCGMPWTAWAFDAGPSWSAHASAST